MTQRYQNTYECALFKDTLLRYVFVHYLVEIKTIEFHHCVHKLPPLGPTQRWLNPFHSFTFVPKIHLILPSTCVQFSQGELAGSLCVNITVFWDVMFFSLVDRYQKPAASAFKEVQVTAIWPVCPSLFQPIQVPLAFTYLHPYLLSICLSYIIFLHDLHWYLENGGSRVLWNVKEIAHFHMVLLPRTIIIIIIIIKQR